MELKFRTALVVDDSIFMQRSIGKLLSRFGIEKIFFAKDADDAIEKYQTHRPDVVTLDMVMPGKNGFACLKEILEYDSNAVVVLVSSLGNENMKKEAYSYGAKGYLVKPFNESSLFETLSNIMVT